VVSGRALSPAGGRMPAALLAHRFDGPEGGEPLLLLNGGFMSMASWEPCSAPLAAQVRVLRCDFRGQLLSPGAAHRDLAGNVEDLVTLLDHLGLERVHVLGTSFGGEVALLLAARQPQRVASLVAVTVTDHASDGMRRSGEDLRGVVAELLAGGDRGRFHDALIEHVYSRGYVEQQGAALAQRRRQVARLPDEWFVALEDLLTAVESFDLRPELGRIRAPTLVVVAGDDRVTPPERGRAVAAAITGALVVEHATSGHVLILEQTEWLVEQVLAFLSGLTTARARRASGA
jgi:3-oxoadipate enol-lactonase